MSPQPIRKLNKRLIFWCLVGLIALSLPAVISLASFNRREKNTEQKHHEAHANMNAHDSKAITGTEHFPETYSDVKNFEKELAVERKRQEPVLEALAKAEQKEEEIQLKPHFSYGYHGREDDSWREAVKREQKQRASDHYEAKRSDIMFVNNARNKKTEVLESESDEILKMMNKAMAREEDSNQGPSDPNDMFMLKNTNDKDHHKSFLSNNKRGVGDIKMPSQFMVSEGTQIHAILLSEINTELPGPILARVSHNIWDSKTGQTLLIPQNSKLIGEYNSTVGNGQTRAQIVWTRIIYPNEQSVELGRMVGVDKKGTSGTAGMVDNHYDRVALALMMTTALSAGVRMTQGKHDPRSATIGEDLGNSLAQETARLGSRIADKMLSIKPTITVPMGERLNVFVEQDLHLRPYSG